MSKAPTQFPTLEDLLASMADGIQPPENITVSEWAAKNRKLNNPGAYVGPWLNEKVPYMVDPMNVLTSTRFTSMVFVSSAQSAKTDIMLNWLGHTVECDPSDMMIIQTTNALARDFSKRRIDRFHRYTKTTGEKLITRRDADNTFDKFYKNGMMLTLSWPSINELSGRPIRNLWLTDYDRMPEDLDHEGSPFFLAKKRATTFGKFGMTVAESSPGREIENPKWMPSSPHEAPPCSGILGLYNLGDRRRHYWMCLDCYFRFEPDFPLLKWPDSKDLMECAEAAWMECPCCGHKMYPENKYDLNLEGRWLIEGQTWDEKGNPVGKGRRSDTASFWLKGVAAAFAEWKTLVFNYLNAEEEYERTGDEQALKTTVNTDQGNPYKPRGSANERLPEELKARAEELPEKEVPPGVRFIVATIDTQKRYWVVQVHGVCPGGDLVVIDRFNIRKSKRLDEDGDPWPVEPGVYSEDWDLITEQVLLKSYPLSDGSGRRMPVKAAGCDSGGSAGVTAKAYEFWRKLRDTSSDNLHKRFLLIKGSSHKAAPRWKVDYPDAQRKDRHAGARGDVPVLFINPNTVKDMLDNMLDCKQAGAGMVRFANWLPDNFYTELTVETKTVKGWENPKSLRNESWDLLTYCIAICLCPLVRIEVIDWDEPPGWADEWDDNDLIFSDGAETNFAIKKKSDYDLARLGSLLG